MLIVLQNNCHCYCYIDYTTPFHHHMRHPLAAQEGGSACWAEIPAVASHYCLAMAWTGTKESVASLICSTEVVIPSVALAASVALVALAASAGTKVKHRTVVVVAVGRTRLELRYPMPPDPHVQFHRHGLAHCRRSHLYRRPSPHSI